MDHEYVVKNMRAQYKVPNHIQDLSTIKEWFRRMGCSQYMIRTFEHAWQESKKEKADEEQSL